MSICLHVIYSCFHDTSQLGSCDGCLRATKDKNIYYLALYKQSFQTVLDQRLVSVTLKSLYLLCHPLTINGMAK